MNIVLSDVTKLKALLLSESYISIKHELLEYCTNNLLSLSQAVRGDNLYNNTWIFIRLDEKLLVRMVVEPNNSRFELTLSDSVFDRYDIYDLHERRFVASNLKLETVVRHCPEQLFYSLYKTCKIGCKFCPYQFATPKPKVTIETILEEFYRLGNSCKAIGFTSGIPKGLSEDEVTLEIIELCQQLRAKLGSELPIGASPKQPSRENLLKLKEAGVTELRLNLEIFNSDLAKILMPQKDYEYTLHSISEAVSIFGRGKVSSNLIVGIGESDKDIVDGITALAERGAIATLYPYDSVAECDRQLSKLVKHFGRPSAERLLRLAVEHQRILAEYALYPENLIAMCPGCRASHIMPMIDH